MNHLDISKLQLRLKSMLLAIFPWLLACQLHATPVFEPVNAFVRPPEVPTAKLMQGSDGNFYGTTASGGASGFGTVFKMTASGTVTTLIHFNSANGREPKAGLIQGSDGNFYGTTYYGGSSDKGTVFKMTATGTLTTLVNFNTTNGSYPHAGLIQGSNGNFYGTTSSGGSGGHGTVFKMTASGTLTTLVGFNFTNGWSPIAGLIQGSDGNFYGTTHLGGTSNKGTVFKMTPTGTLSTLVHFNSTNGSSPFASLVQGSDGNFYGTTYLGGTIDFGTIFKMTPTGTLTTLVNINSTLAGIIGGYISAGLIQGSDGNFYGTISTRGSGGSGTVFKMTASGAVTTLVGFNSSNGGHPVAELVQGIDGNFYGTTPRGGISNNGTVFKMAPTGTLTTLVYFNAPQGRDLPAGLTQGIDGSFYGTTEGGGTSGNGTVFKMNASGTFTTLVHFNTTNGLRPLAGLIQGSDGNFYGTTYLGGTNNDGTVFKMTASGTLTTLVHFNTTNGLRPLAGLIQGSDGNFYGTTQYGGTGNNGTVFKMTPTGTLTTLVHFNSTNGSAPFAGLVQGSDGNFYGTTSSGGSSGYGTVFRMSASGTLTTLVHFNSTNGSDPYAALWQGSDGNFYGTTFGGGSSNHGTVFRVTPNGSLTTLVHFNFTNGRGPNSGLIQGSDGNFYGTTYLGGTSGFGTSFKMTPTGTLTTLVHFNATNGSYPSAGLILGSDGNYYGTTVSGGTTSSSQPAGAGQIFRIRMGPVVTSQGATNITATTSKLNATVNPGGFATPVSFQYGTSPTLATFTTVSAGTVPVGTTDTAVTANLTGLSPATKYYFRVVASNDENLVPQFGSILNFTTLSTNANLTALALSSGTLTPTFASATTSYTASVSNSTSSITVTPTVAHASATVKVNGVTVASGTASSALALNVGSNVISTVVTAQSGNTRTYTVTVTRIAPPAITTPTSTAITSATATLGGNVTADGGAAISERGVVYSRTSQNANPLIGGTSVTKVVGTGTTGVFSVNVGGLSSGTGYSFKAYAINSAGTSYTSVATLTTISANANLSGLVISNGILSPVFASDTTSYSASVSNGTNSITVTPTAAHASANVKVNGVTVASGTASGPIALVAGNNVINTVVTAQDGVTTRTYGVNVLLNTSPTGITLTQTFIPENVPAGTAVGNFNTVDTDAGDSFTYSLAAGSGDTDNAAFTINGAVLVINQSPNFEAKTTYSIRVRTTDQAGASHEGVFVITITDVNEAPVLELPSSPLQAEATGPDGAIVQFNISANDPEDGVLQAVSSPPSGSLFPLGETTVNVSATDTGSLTTAGVLLVRVQDTTAPSVTAPPNVAVDGAGAQGAVVNYASATAIDAVGVASISYSHPSGGTFPRGETTVTVTATDAAQNVGSATFTVTVTGPSVVPVAETWHLTAYAFQGTSSPVSFNEELVTGTATLVAKEGSETDYILTFNIEDYTETFELTLDGVQLTGGGVDDIGNGFSEQWRMRLRVIDNDTLLLSDFYATMPNNVMRLVSFDCAGGVLTRNPIPTPDPAAWPGAYPTLDVQDFGVNDGTGIESDTEEIGLISLEDLGSGTYKLMSDSGEDGNFSATNGVLKFSETDDSSELIWEDEWWRIVRVLFEDRAYLLQIGDGRVFLVGSGMEAVRSSSKTTSEAEVYIDWADVYVGLFGPESVPPDGSFSAWLADMGLEGTEAQPNAKPFADGLPNLVRYAMNLGASPPAAQLPVFAMQEVGGLRQLTMDFRVRKTLPGVFLVAQESASMDGEWLPVPSDRIQQLSDDDSMTNRYRALLPITPGGRGFLRLMAVQAEAVAD